MNAQLPAYCPGFYLWDVPTVAGVARVAADNADGAAHVARYQDYATTYTRTEVTGPAVFVSRNPVAVAWDEAHK
jgi:hypothetical protein